MRLFVTFPASSYSLKDFSFYTMKKLSPGTRSFSLRGNWGKLIFNLHESDHGWSFTIFRVSGPREVAEESDCGSVPTAWIVGPITERSELISELFMERASRLYYIDYNKYNWSWLLDPHKS